MRSLREIGSAFIRLFVRKDEFSAGLKQAEQEANQAAQNIGAAANQAGKQAETATTGVWAALRGVRKTLNDTIGVVLSLIARFTAVLAVIGLIVGAAKAFYDWTNKSDKKWQELKERVDSTEQSINKLLRGGDKYTEAIDDAARAHAEAKNAAVDQLAWVEKLREENRIRGLDANDNLGAEIRILKEREALQEKALEQVNRLRDAQQKANQELHDRPPAPEIQEYDPEKDPILASATEFAKRMEESREHAIKMFFDIRAEQTKQWSESVEYVIDLYRRLSAEATAEWGQQIQNELRRAAEEFDRLQSRQRNQGASGDIKTMIGLLKRLVDER